MALHATESPGHPPGRLGEVITQIHVRSRRTYGWRRIRAELADAYGQQVNKKLIRSSWLPRHQRTSGPAQGQAQPAHRATTEDLVQRLFARNDPDQLWMTDIKEHPTRERKLYCCVVLDAWSRRVVGWSLDRRPTAAMVNSALGMAIEARLPRAGTLIHSDHGSQGGIKGSSQHLKTGGGSDDQQAAAATGGSCVGHQGPLVEGHLDTVDRVRYCSHRKCLPSLWGQRRQTPSSLLLSGHFPRVGSARKPGQTVNQGLGVPVTRVKLARPRPG